MASRGIRTAVALLIAFAVASTALPAPAGAVAGTPPGWGPSEQVDYPHGFTSGAGSPVLAVTQDGHALAAWDLVSPSTGYRVVQYALYSPGVGWTSAVTMSAGAADAQNPAVAGAPNGSLMVVWSHYSFIPSLPAEIRSVVWVPGEGFHAWEQASVSATGSSDNPRVAFDGQGKAVAVWRETDTETNVSANHYVGGLGWGANRQTLDTLPSSVSFPEVSADLAGNAIAVWAQDDSGLRIFASRFGGAAGWGAPQAVDGNTVDSLGPRVAVNGSGGAVVTWTDIAFAGPTPMYSQFTPGAGWSAALPLTPSFPGAVSNLRVAASLSGEFVCAWISDVLGGRSVLAVIVGPGAAAGALTNVSAGRVPYAENPSLAALGDGRVIVVWREQEPGDPYGSSAGAWWSPSGGFLAGERLGTSQINEEAPIVAGAGDHAHLVWLELAGGPATIWSRAYTTPDMSPPWVIIDSPADGTVTANSTIVVSGRAEAGTRVVINGVQAVVVANGAFSLALGLLPGDNAIRISASDASGNTILTTMTVTFDDPVPALEAALAAAQAELAAALVALDELWAALNETRADLNDTRDALNATQVELEATQAELATAQAELAAAQAALAAAEARLGAVEGDLVAARAEINQTREDVVQTRADLNATRDDLVATQADLAATKAEQAETNARLQAETDQAKADASFALLLAALGAVLGGAGVVTALVLGRRKWPPDE